MHLLNDIYIFNAGILQGTSDLLFVFDESEVRKIVKICEQVLQLLAVSEVVDTMADILTFVQVQSNFFFFSEIKDFYLKPVFLKLAQYWVFSLQLTLPLVPLPPFEFTLNLAPLLLPIFKSKT